MSASSNLTEAGQDGDKRTIRDRRSNLHARGERDRPQWAVGRKPDVVRLRQSRNAEELRYTPTMRYLTHSSAQDGNRRRTRQRTHVWLGDGNRTPFKVWAEVAAREEPLAERDRRADQLREVRRLLWVSGQQRL